VINRSSAPVKILAVSPVRGKGSGLKGLGILAAGKERYFGAMQYLPEYPPSEPKLGKLFSPELAVRRIRCPARMGVGWAVFVK
jgi:hypothetical protein